MKTIVSIILATILLTGNVHAFRTHGKINEYLIYKRLELQDGYTPKACGLIKNKTKKRIHIFADLIFETRTKFVDLAKVHIKVPAGGKINFCEYLKRGNYKGAKDAVSARWDVYMLKVNGKKIYFHESIY